MNIMHSSATPEWLTPISILALARHVLGGIDLDPCSTAAYNLRVGAQQYITKEQDALTTPWPYDCSVFMNSPGGRLRGQSLNGLFWGRLMDYRASGRLKHAVVMMFSLEALQSTQRYTPCAAEFPLCIPRKRIAFDRPSGATGDAPSHSNCLVYVPGTQDRTVAFVSAFADVGAVLNVGVLAKKKGAA